MNAKKKLLEALELEINKRKAYHLFRSLKPYDFFKIDFSSNDYLGLNYDNLLSSFLKNLISENLKTIGSTGSRLISGHRKSFEEVEEEFSKYVNVPDSLLFHSGYAANVANIQALLSLKDYAVVDRLCHASILDGVRISGAKKIYFQHNDINNLEEVIRNKCNRSTKSKIWIFTEGIFSMDGDIPPIKEIIEIANRYECNLFIDEAHSIGIYGKQGKGVVSTLNAQSAFSLIHYPLGKAVGIMGCFAGVDNITKEYLINFSRGFIYSTAQPEILVRLISKILEYLPTEDCENRRKKVEMLSQFARNLLQENDFSIGNSITHIIPIILGDEKLTMGTVEKLKEKNYNVVGIRPPSVPEGTSRIRLNIHSYNTEEQIFNFVQDLKKIIH